VPRHSDTDIRIIPPRVKGGLVLFGAHDWGALLQQAKKNNISRARVCTHMDNLSAVQEMLIAFMKDSYVRPHRHLGKSESFYVIEGELSVIFFDENGKETDRVALSASDPGKPFYFRGERENWHTVLIESEYAFIHETTTGPYEYDDRLLAPWAPAEGESRQIHEFLADLRKSM
jgi:cupin fold WbuC family metalloprotein